MILLIAVDIKVHRAYSVADFDTEFGGRGGGNLKFYMV